MCACVCACVCSCVFVCLVAVVTTRPRVVAMRVSNALHTHGFYLREQIAGRVGVLMCCGGDDDSDGGRGGGYEFGLCFKRVCARQIRAMINGKQRPASNSTYDLLIIYK